MESGADAGPGDHQAQVIVVGAGPAGSATALHLARAGVDVLLLEKGTFPGTRCAGTASPRGACSS